MFVVLCGADGSGKSTQAKLLAEALRAKGRFVTEKRFPERNNVTGRVIYAWLKGDVAQPIDMSSQNQLAAPICFQSLMHANRLEELPALRKAMGEGDLVVDRYWPSGYAYGAADGLDPKWLTLTSSFFPKPTLAILLDVDVETAEARRAKRMGLAETYEKAPREHRAKVISNYRELWSWHIGEVSWVTVNARGLVGETAGRILAAVEEVRSLGGERFK